MTGRYPDHPYFAEASARWRAQVDHRRLAERYARGVRRRWPVASRAVPWGLLVQILLLVVRYFVLDARKDVAVARTVLGPMSSELYLGDIPVEVVSDWETLGEA